MKITIKTFVGISFALMMTALVPSTSLAQCTPTSATLCIGDDDASLVWINGNAVSEPTSFGGIYYTSAGNPPCVSVPAGDFVTGTNVIAVADYNTTPGYVWETWSLDITCSNGNHAYLSSSSGNVVVTSVLPGNGGIPGPPPGNDGNGVTWWGSNYANATSGNGWNAAVADTGVSSIWDKQVRDPQTGAWLTPISYDAGAGDGSAPATQVLYFRQTFTLNAVAPPAASRRSSYVNYSRLQYFRPRVKSKNARTFPIFLFVGCDSPYSTRYRGCGTSFRMLSADLDRSASLVKTKALPLASSSWEVARRRSKSG